MQDQITRAKYDIWTVPQGLLMNGGLHLHIFVKTAQDLIRLGHYSEAYRYISPYNNSCMRGGDASTQCAFSSLLLGILHRKMSQFCEGIKEIIHSKHHFLSLADNENQVRCTLAMGDIWRSYGRYKSSSDSDLYYYHALRKYNQAESALKRLKTVNNYTLILLKIQILWNKARVYHYLGESPNYVYACLSQAWNYSKDIGSLWAQEECAQQLGRHFEKIEKYDLAMNWYEIALEKASVTNNADRLIETYVFISRLMHLKGDYIGSGIFAQKGLSALEPLLAQSLPNTHQFFVFEEELRKLAI